MLLKIKVLEGDAEILSDQGSERVSAGTEFEVKTRYLALSDVGAPRSGEIVPGPGTPNTSEKDHEAREELNLPTHQDKGIPGDVTAAEAQALRETEELGGVSEEKEKKGRSRR